MNDKYLHSIPQDFGPFSEILQDSSKSERYTVHSRNSGLLRQLENVHYYKRSTITRETWWRRADVFAQ